MLEQPVVGTSLPGGALSGDLGFLLARANASAVAEANARLAPLGLRVRAFSALALVADGARHTQRELAEVLRLDPSQIVVLVDELEAAGLARRESDPSDRRAKVVVATSAGRATSVRARDALDGSAGASLFPGERDELVRLLRLIAFPPA